MKLGDRVLYVDVNGANCLALVASHVPDEQGRVWLTVLPPGNQPYHVQAVRGGERGQVLRVLEKGNG